jgi:hypothetical protein
MVHGTPACALGLVLGACRLGLEDRYHPQPQPGAEVQSQPVKPLPTTSGAGEALYQLLYAGEVGEQAGALGDRVRAAAFLEVLGLDAAQLAGLLALAEAHAILREQERLAREALDARELEAYGPPYRALLALLEQPGQPPDADLARIAEQLELARATTGSDQERAQHFRRIHTYLDQVRVWVETLDAGQQERLRGCLFLLQRRLGPFTNPGDYSEVVSPLWGAGDFGSLTRTVRPPDERPLDIATLWSVENTDGKHELRIHGLQLQALVLLALEEPALADAADSRLRQITGTRDDGSLP